MDNATPTETVEPTEEQLRHVTVVDMLHEILERVHKLGEKLEASTERIIHQ